MPTKERIDQRELQALIREQAKDRESTYVFPEKVTPQKQGLSFGLTLAEYIHLLLDMGILTRRQIAHVLGVSPSCVSQHRWNAYRKLGPEMTATFKKICKVIKTLDISLIPAPGSPPRT